MTVAMGWPGARSGFPAFLTGSDPLSASARQTMKALIVDDSRTMRMIIGRILRELGFETHEAGNGLEGLDRLRELGRADVALVDWNMPEMTGYEFIQAVRAKSEYDDMKVMMVTTETEMSQMASALEAGANEYVMKPFTKEVIQEKLGLLGVA
jgi:two-component system chemotaxis response regulator CheY